MAKLSPVPVWQILDELGVSVPGALLYTFEAGAGTTPAKATYTDYTETVAASNPIVADSAGRFSVWLGSGYYKFVLTDGDGATLFDPDHIEGSVIWTKDHISAAGGAGDSFSMLTVENIEALRALSGYEDNTLVYVQGYYESNDGGGGFFFFDAASTADDNAGTIILDDAEPATGRWIRFVHGPVNTHWFGAGLGAINDSPLLQKAYDFAASIEADVRWGEGDYAVEYPQISITHSHRTFGENARLQKTTSTEISVFSAEDITGLKIDTLTVECLLCDLVRCTDVDISKINNDSQFSMGTGVHPNIKLCGCSHVSIHNNNTKNMVQGVLVTSDDETSGGSFSHDIQIVDNSFRNEEDSLYSDIVGVEIGYAFRVDVCRNHFVNTNPGAQGGASYTGYAIKEAAASVTALRIEENEIVFDNGHSRSVGISLASASDCIIAHNKISYTNGTLTEYVLGIAGAAKASVIGNMLQNCGIDYTLVADAASLLINSNQLDSCYSAGIHVEALEVADQVTCIITDNHLSEAGHAGVLLENVRDSIITGNSILDANTRNSAVATEQSGIILSGCAKAQISGNRIANDITGYAQYGVEFSQNDEDTKWVYFDNTFSAMGSGDYHYGYASVPYGSLWSVGEKAYNTSKFPADVLTNGWLCTARSLYAAAATADPEDTTFDVGGGALLPDILPGDVIGAFLTTGVFQWTTVKGISVSGTTVIVTPADKLNGGVNIGASVYRLRWRNLYPETADIAVSGGAYEGYRSIFINGRRVLYSNEVGLELTLYDASTLVWQSSTVFTLADAPSRTAFIAALAALTSSTLAILTSANSQLFAGGIIDTVQAELVRHGLYKLCSLYTLCVDSHSYAAVFLGADSGGVNRQALEVANADLPASLRCTFKNGILSGNHIITALSSGNPDDSTPAVISNTDRACFFGGTAAAKRSIDIEVTGDNLVLPAYHGNIVYVSSPSTIYTLKSISGGIENSILLLLMGPNVRIEIEASGTAGTPFYSADSTDVDGGTAAEYIKPIWITLVNKPLSGGGSALRWVVLRDPS
jgi:hypothetical protein